ncbi:hypothetical protein Lal_00029872, partial [Lupinus albus]
QNAIPSKVGLLIRKFSSILKHTFIFDLIPNPQNDSGEPASSISDSQNKKPSNSKSQPSDSLSLFIDKDWVAEHARQVCYPQLYRAAFTYVSTLLLKKQAIS